MSTVKFINETVADPGGSLGQLPLPNICGAPIK